MNINLVIKFGGSSITEKEKFETLKPEALKAATQLIKSCVDKGLSCIVVHGAGSFGHHQAKQYKVNDGWAHLDGDLKAVNIVKMGMGHTRLSVTKLHKHVVAALLDENIPAIGIPGFGEWQTDDRTVIEHNIHTVKSLINEGFVPVLHGDCILDRTLGCVILSGDIIIQTICQECTVDRVVFLTSIDGVFNKPPLDFPEAELQPCILVNSKGEVATETTCSGTAEGIMSGSCGNDVTGGMTLKLKTAINIARNSAGKTPVYVCKVGSEYSKVVCSNGQVAGNDQGTVIKYIDT